MKTSRLPKTLGPIIARRSLSRGPIGHTAAVVEIGRPRKSRGRDEFYCPYRIIGIGDDDVAAAYGLDAVQALQLAHRAVGARLTVYHDLTWLGGETGFPPVDERLPIEWARAIEIASHRELGPMANASPWPPLEVLASPRQPRRSFFFTKSYLPHVLLRRELFPAATDALVHYGVPSARLCELLRSHAETTRLPLRFVGDLDPLDLTVYAALMTGGAPLRGRRRAPVPVVYVGIDDEWLALCERHMQWSRTRRRSVLFDGS
jgi:hypothetical protein